MNEMKRVKFLKLMKIALIFVLITLIVSSGSKYVSDLYLTEKTETEHLIFSWTKDEARFFNCLPAAVENRYQRISNNLNSSTSKKITIKMYDNPWIYNLSWGNPFPWPKHRSTGNADYQNLIIDILMPPLNDPLYKDRDFLPIMCTGYGLGHEITHILLSEINPEFTRGWWQEGIAQYEDLLVLQDNDQLYKLTESQEQAVRDRVSAGYIPTFEELSVRNFNTFFRMNGYEFSKVFIDFAVNEYGCEVIHRMAKYPDDYERVFNASEGEVWQQWKEYLVTKYYE